MKNRLKPIQPTSINKSQASFQFHMLDMMSEMVKQQKETNSLLKKMMNVESQSPIKASSLFYKEKLEETTPLGLHNQSVEADIQRRREQDLSELKSQTKYIQKIDLMVQLFKDSMSSAEQINKQILNQLKLLNKPIEHDNMNQFGYNPSSKKQILDQRDEEFVAANKNKLATNQKHYSRLSQIQPYSDRRQIKVKIYFQQILKQYQQHTLSKDTFQKAVKEWLGTVYRATASVSWNILQNQLLTFDQTKILFTENIIYNYIQLMKEIRLLKNFNQNQKLATSIVNNQAVEVLNFLCNQYPQTKIQAPNLAIRSELDVIDEREDIRYDMLGQSKIPFRYNERKQYAQVVMKFLNYLIDYVDDKFQAFQNYFWKFFKNLYYPRHLRRWPNQNKQTDLDAQYKAKVKTYTKIALGRKIPKNIPKYTDEEINNGIFFLKSPRIMRVVAKWLEELSVYIKNPKEKIQKRSYPFKTHDGKQLILDFAVRNALYLAIESRKQDFLKKLTEIQNNCFNIQGKLTLQEYVSQENLAHLSQEQINVGLFSTNLKDALATFLFLQLNEIIHFLLEIPNIIDVQKIGVDNHHYQKKAKQDLRKVNLVTFSIFDLLRCKCISGQDEIIYLIKMLKEMHYDQKSTFQLVRVKDRLEQGTRDIMINAQFSAGQPVFQIQLAVVSQLDIKQDLLGQYNHFLYELRRSESLGPLIQNVSIWSSLQQRALYFSQVAKKRFKNAKNKEHEHKCSNPIIIQFTGPIVCDTCKTFYHIQRTCLSNQICLTCNQNICGQCWYMGLKGHQRHRFVFGKQFDKQIFEHITEYDDFSHIEKFPQYSFFVKKPYLKGQLSFLRHYPSIQDHPRDIVQSVYKKSFGKVIVRGFLTQKDKTKKAKISSFIVFGIDPKYISFKTVDQIADLVKEQPSIKIISLLQEPNYIVNIQPYDNIKKSTTEYINYLKVLVQQKCIQDHITIYSNKETNLIVLCQFNLNREDLSRKLTKRGNWHILQKLCGVNTTILSLQHQNVTQQLMRDKLIETIGQRNYKNWCQNLKKVFLNFGKIQSIEDLKYMTKIQVLSISNNRLNSLKGIETMSNLSQLYFDKNHVKDLLSVKNLVKIRILIANWNEIQSLQGTENLVELEKFEIYRNKIKIIQGFTDNWKKLGTLYLRNNQIADFDNLLGLQKLQNLSLSKNPITQFGKFTFVPSLTAISLSYLYLTEIPIQSICMLQLVELTCHFNKIKSMKGVSRIKTLKILGLMNNQIEKIEDLQNLRLQVLILANNKIKRLQNLKKSFETIQELDLQGNPLQDCHQLLQAKRKFKLLYTQDQVSKQVKENIANMFGDNKQVLKFMLDL